MQLGVCWAACLFRLMSAHVPWSLSSGLELRLQLILRCSERVIWSNSRSGFPIPNAAWIYTLLAYHLELFSRSLLVTRPTLFCNTMCRYGRGTSLKPTSGQSLLSGGVACPLGFSMAAEWVVSPLFIHGRLCSSQATTKATTYSRTRRNAC